MRPESQQLGSTDNDEISEERRPSSGTSGDESDVPSTDESCSRNVEDKRINIHAQVLERLDSKKHGSRVKNVRRSMLNRPSHPTLRLVFSIFCLVTDLLEQVSLGHDAL